MECSSPRQKKNENSNWTKDKKKKHVSIEYAQVVKRAKKAQ